MGGSRVRAVKKRHAGCQAPPLQAWRSQHGREWSTGRRQQHAPARRARRSSERRAARAAAAARQAAGRSRAPAPLAAVARRHPAGLAAHALDAACAKRHVHLAGRAHLAPRTARDLHAARHAGARGNRIGEEACGRSGRAGGGWWVHACRGAMRAGGALCSRHASGLAPRWGDPHQQLHAWHAAALCGRSPTLRHTNETTCAASSQSKQATQMLTDAAGGAEVAIAGRAACGALRVQGPGEGGRRRRWTAARDAQRASHTPRRAA